MVVVYRQDAQVSAHVTSTLGAIFFIAEMRADTQRQVGLWDEAKGTRESTEILL